MIGLPGSGKTSWIREFLRNETERQWYVLSSNAVLDQMKVCITLYSSFYTYIIL